ncbi:MAG: ABC transporter substrate-binding protein [Chloroflexi bacterium]|nr:ABC transporter substrate-binding protein [Chloroflexota bacterium]
MNGQSKLARFLPIAFVLIVIVLAACVAPTPSTIAPTTAKPSGPSGDLKIAVRDDAKNINPYLAATATDQRIVGLMYDTLLAWDDNKGLVPWLASEYKCADDGLSCVFKIDPKATWHDGTALTEKDVEYSFNMIREKQFPSIVASIAALDKVTATGEREITMTFKQKQVDTLRFVGTVVSIIPKAQWDKVPDAKNYANWDKPTGSGAFKLKERVEGQYIVLENTSAHYRFKPAIKTITLQVTKDENVSLLALKKGDVDAIYDGISPNVAIDIQKNPANYPGIKVVTTGGTGTSTLMWNTRKAPYDNAAFRKAIAQAVDVDAIIKNALQGFADRASAGLVPPAAGAFFNKNISPIKYDDAAAKAALDAAGFKDANNDGLRELPDGKPLKIEILTLNVPPSTDIGDLIVAQLKKVGINASTTPLTSDAQLERLRTANFDAALANVSLSVPNMMFYFFNSTRGDMKDGRVVGNNRSGFKNEEYDKLSVASLAEFDQAKRVQTHNRLQEILGQELPVVPLYHSQVLGVYNEARFTGWVVKPGTGIENFESYEKLAYTAK